MESKDPPACTRYHRLKVPEVPADPKWAPNLEKNYHNIRYPPDELYGKHINLAYKLLTEHGYHVETANQEKDNLHVEYHVYLGDGTDDCVSSHFDSHNDNQGATHDDVHTCIFYFQNTFKTGGELLIQDGFEGSTIEEIDPRIWNVVLLDGATYHAIRPVFGKGKRRCLVVQMKQSTSTEESKV